MPEDYCVAIFLAKVLRFILCENFANFYMVIKFADLDSELNFSAMRQILPGDTYIGFRLTGIEIYSIISFCIHFAVGDFANISPYAVW